VTLIYIGNYVMFGPIVTIRGGNHRFDMIGKYMYNVKETEKLPENDQDVVIEDDVWVGCNVTILKGVTIGHGSDIAEGAVVIKSPPILNYWRQSC
jgi:maltose O-acetyltransferase